MREDLGLALARVKEDFSRARATALGRPVARSLEGAAWFWEEASNRVVDLPFETFPDFRAQNTWVSRSKVRLVAHFFESQSWKDPSSDVDCVYLSTTPAHSAGNCRHSCFHEPSGLPFRCGAHFRDDLNILPDF